jgi:arylsulfatase A-like enzyme
MPKSFQGTSFLPWLREGQAELKNRYVFSEAVHLGGRWPPLWGQDSSGKKLCRIRSCRSEDWKYIWDEEQNRKELYQLRRDPDEKKNLANHEPKMTRHFESIMTDHFSELDSSKLVASSTTKTALSPQEEEGILRRLRDLGYL